MALIGADVHANGKHGSLIPRFRVSTGFVCSYGYSVIRVQTGARRGSWGTVEGPAVGRRGGFRAGRRVLPVPGKRLTAHEGRGGFLLLGEGAEPAQGAVLGDPDGAR